MLSMLINCKVSQDEKSPDVKKSQVDKTERSCRRKTNKNLACKCFMHCTQCKVKLILVLCKHKKLRWGRLLFLFIKIYFSQWKFK